MINYDVKFLTFEETLPKKGNDFKSFKYETKKRIDQTVYDSSKRNYCERRGGYWRPPHPRQLKHLENKLRDKTVVVSDWTSDTLVTIVFSSGEIAYLTVKEDTLDITQILFDSYLVSKLSGQTVTNVALCKSHMIMTHTDRMATVVTFGKNNIGNLPCRIADKDPHLQSIELGGCNRRTERHVSCVESNNGVRVLVWSVTTAEPAPWSPIVEDQANLHLYTINGQNISLTAYHQLENETLSAELSHKNDNVVHIVEQINYHKNGVSLDWVRYEVVRGERAVTLSARHSTHVSLSAPVRLVRRSACDSRLLVACIDSSLHVVHSAAGLTHTTTPGFIATDVRWAGELIIAAEESGKLQCFDRALSLLHYHSKCFDLTSYLRDSRRMRLLATRSAKSGPLILITFSGGPLALLHITHPRLLTAWIRVRRTTNAVALLRAMDWDTEGTECLWAVNKLVCIALRGSTEGGEGLAQAALGTFLAPAAPLPRAARRCALPLQRLARNYFHHLLRRGRIEKALSLAVDLAAWDLFADARWAATRMGMQHLASEAAGLAAYYSQQDTPESECSESCSDCSSHSYTGSEDEMSASPEAVKTKPPPLPRVSLANQSTLMQVPITQTEPKSTNSIRPNLHQYLERDNTIWNKDLRDDTFINNSYSIHPKPILNTQSVRWHSTDVLSNYKPMRNTLLSINEGAVKPSHTVDIIPRPDNRLTSHFKHIYQKELREEAPSTLYRYQNNNSYTGTNIKDRTFRNDMDSADKRSGEKNKVKFSDTVTISVVSSQEAPQCSEASRELAGSAPAPQYLSAFPPAPAAGNSKPPKIKVVHFGMV